MAALLEGRISEAMMKKLEYDDLKKNNRLIDKKTPFIEHVLLLRNAMSAKLFGTSTNWHTHSRGL